MYTKPQNLVQKLRQAQQILIQAMSNLAYTGF